MKIVILVLAYVTLATSSKPRDKRSYTHTQAYPVPVSAHSEVYHSSAHSQAYPVSVHTVVRPSDTLPVYEYPESTQIDTQSRTVYSVSVPITHTVHLEQPAHSRQVIYHNPPANIPTYTYNTPQVYVPKVYSPSVYTPQYNSVYPHVQRRVYTYTPSEPWVYRRYADPWC